MRAGRKQHLRATKETQFSSSLAPSRFSRFVPPRMYQGLPQSENGKAVSRRGSHLRQVGLFFFTALFLTILLLYAFSSQYENSNVEGNILEAMNDNIEVSLLEDTIYGDEDQPSINQEDADTQNLIEEDGEALGGEEDFDESIENKQGIDTHVGNDNGNEADVTEVQQLNASNQTDSSSDEDVELGGFTLPYLASYCTQEASKNYQKSSYQYLLAAANCGWGYSYKNSSARHKPWKIYLSGPSWTRNIRDLSGCPRKCPFSPRCTFTTVTQGAILTDADVIVTFQNDVDHPLHHLLRKGGRKFYQVLYWREAVFKPATVRQQKTYDFEMGVHYYSGVNNPQFLRTPIQLMNMVFPPEPPLEFLPFGKRTGGFALSVISDCHAISKRERYIHLLQLHLGANKVHRYGKCGDRELPPKPIQNAAKLISTYKFYLSMENTIQDGYVTEKLFFILTFPILPVYFGPANAPNITTIPSYIRVTDFNSPKALGDYLLYLNENPDEYMKYHKWRWDNSLFEKSYLERLSTRVAGPEELLAYKKMKISRFPRAAQCCRLCDENYVKFATATRTPDSYINPFLRGADITRLYLGQ